MTQAKQIYMTVPMEEEELSRINSLCLKLGTDRAKLVRHAVRYYIREVVEKNPAAVDVPKRIWTK